MAPLQVVTEAVWPPHLAVTITREANPPTQLKISNRSPTTSMAGVNTNRAYLSTLSPLRVADLWPSPSSRTPSQSIRGTRAKSSAAIDSSQRGP